ncbi:MAG: TldD/PmbA family protein [Candidatus Bathyarchaeia archaeon]
MKVQEISPFIVNSGLRFGADEVAAITAQSTSRQVRFANNEVTVTKAWDEIRAGILLKKDRRVLTASISELSTEGVQKALKDLISMVNLMAPHKNYAPLPQGPFKYPAIPGLYDNRLPKLQDKNVDYVESAISSALDCGGKRVAGTLQTTDSETSLTTSGNVEATQKKTTIKMVVRCLLNGESSGMGTSCGTTLDDFNPEEAGREAGRFAKMSERLKPGRSGRYNVILSRIASAGLFDIIGGMSSAFYVDSGFSCLAEKLGEKIASDEIAVYDDATATEGLGSTPFDDEGYPTSRTPIIEDGVLRSYLHNSFTAKKHQTKSTANAGWISPRASNIVVKEGRVTEEELFKGVKDGLYVNNLTYIRFQDYRKGDFTASTRDGVFRIKDGEITDPIKGLRLSDNLIYILRNITGLSKEAKQISHWWMGFGTPSVKTPLIRVKDVGFTVPTK